MRRSILFTYLFVVASLAGCGSSDSGSEESSVNTSNDAPNEPSTVGPDDTRNPDVPVASGGDSDQTPASIKIIYLDDESVSLPSEGLFLVSEFIGDLNSDGKTDLLADTTTLLFGAETSAEDGFSANSRTKIPDELFTASVLDFNGNGVADLLLPKYEGNLPNSRFGNVDLILDQQDISNPIVFDGINGARIRGVEPGQESNMTFVPIGDINGDGRDDLAGYLGGEISPAGAAITILYGTTTLPMPEIEVSAFSGDAVDRLIPAEGVRFEAGRLRFVVPLGDINGDSLADFALRYSYLSSSGADSDRVFDMLIVYGDANGIGSVESFDASNATSAGTRLERLVIHDAAGDVNADGIADFIVATQVTVGDRTTISEGVLLGQNWQSKQSFNARELSNRTILFTGYDANFGSLKLHAIGDVNGDGVDDLLAEDAYRMLIIPGGTLGGGGSEIDLKNLPTGVVELRASADTGVDYSYSFEDGQGDVNGDGFADILVYSQEQNVRVLFGKAQF